MTRFALTVFTTLVLSACGSAQPESQSREVTIIHEQAPQPTASKPAATPKKEDGVEGVGFAVSADEDGASVDVKGENGSASISIDGSKR